MQAKDGCGQSALRAFWHSFRLAVRGQRSAGPQSHNLDLIAFRPVPGLTSSCWNTSRPLLNADGPAGTAAHSS